MSDLEHLTASVDEELRKLGAPDEEIARARAAGVIGLLAVVYAALPAEPIYAGGELATRAGMDQEDTKRLWRALGFPDATDGVRVFTEADAEALVTVNALLSAGIQSVEQTVQITRVIGSSMARIAEAVVSNASARPPLAPEAAELVALTATAALETQSRLLDYVWRRHLQAAVRRTLASVLDAGGPRSTYAVGFADLVGFTAMSQQLEPAELARVVTRFEEMAFDLVVNHGGRVAKVIGDEVMFVVGDVIDAVETGLALADAYADDELLSDVRVGIAYGDVLVHEGDYYGPVVNLASRIVNIAVPGSVVVSPSVHDALADDARYALHGLRPRNLKDIGRVRLWRVRRGHPLHG